MTMETPINQGGTHQEEPCASTPTDENPVLRKCWVVLNRLSSAEILKWRRQSSATPELVNLSVPTSEKQLDLNEWVHAIEEMRVSPVPSSNSSSDQYYRRVEELEKTITYLKSHVDCMEKVMSRQQDEIEKLKCEWNQKQCKIDQLEETIRNLNVGPHQQVANEAHDLHEVSTKTSKPDHPFEEENAEKLRRRSGRKRKLGTDFSLIYYALDEINDTNWVESVSTQRPSKKTRQTPDDPPLTVVSNSLVCYQGKPSHSSERINPEVTPPIRLRVIPTEELIENSTVSTENDGQHSVDTIQASATISAFPNGWFWSVPSSASKPPIPQEGCCFSCYEKDNVIHGRHCEKCRSKMMRLEKKFLETPSIAVPKCTHKLNQPMRGCEGCMVRAYILRYNIDNPHKSHVIPYSTVDFRGAGNSTSQLHDPDLSSYSVKNMTEDEIPRLFGFPVAPTQPQPGVFRADSSFRKSSQQVLPGPSSFIFPDAASKSTQNALEDISLSSLLRDSEQPKLGVVPKKALFQSHPTLMSILTTSNLSHQCEQNQNKPQDAISVISVSPKHPSKKKKSISAFPDNWFLVVPEYANKPPTPKIGCCYSCYERKSKLMKQHCVTCWSKAKRLKHAYLKDPNAPNPRCNHPLNLPLRGCEACILRAFIVRYNLQFPDACFPVPYSKVDSCNQVIVEKVPEYLPNPFAGFGFLLNSHSMVDRAPEQHAVIDGASSDIPDLTSLMSPTPGGSSEPTFGLISQFPEKWFSVVPQNPNELPTPRLNHCISCYESKRIIDGYCLTCKRAAKVMEDIYVENPKIPLPRCIHHLNLPMRGCPSCILRAYILTYNKHNPDKPYAIPYEKINSECQSLRIRQNLDPITLNDSDQYLSDSSELGIVAPRTLQPKPTAGTFFPDGWFQYVPDDEYELPIPRHGCCLSCYEYKIRHTQAHFNKYGLNTEGHCVECIGRAEEFVIGYQSSVNSIPQCTHKLNRPMRGCDVCIIRPFIVLHNRRNPLKLFPVPYELVDFEIPLDRIHKLMQPRHQFKSSAQTLPSLRQSKSIQNQTSAPSYSIVSDYKANGLKYVPKHRAVNDENSVIDEQNDPVPSNSSTMVEDESELNTIPIFGITVTDGIATEPVLIPESTVIYNETHHSSNEPVLNPGNDVMYDGNHHPPTEPVLNLGSTAMYDGNHNPPAGPVLNHHLPSEPVPNLASTVVFNENYHMSTELV